MRSRCCSSRSRADRPIGVLLIDLDHFKSINDRFGHAAGDSVLQIFAKTAPGEPAPDRSGRAARRRGVVVVLADASIDNAYLVRTGAAQCLRGERALLDGVALHGPRASACRMIVDPAQDLAKLITLADQAPHLAKARGRNRVEVAPLESSLGEVPRACDRARPSSRRRSHPPRHAAQTSPASPHVDRGRHRTAGRDLFDGSRRKQKVAATPLDALRRTARDFDVRRPGGRSSPTVAIVAAAVTCRRRGVDHTCGRSSSSRCPSAARSEHAVYASAAIAAGPPCAAAAADDAGRHRPTCVNPTNGGRGPLNRDVGVGKASAACQPTWIDRPRMHGTRPRSIPRRSVPEHDRIARRRPAKSGRRAAEDELRRRLLGARARSAIAAPAPRRGCLQRRTSTRLRAPRPWRD